LDHIFGGVKMKSRTVILISILAISGLFVTTPCFSGGIPDRDEDVLFDECEDQIFGTSPTIKDTDGDGIPDGDEDHDGNGLTNLEEQTNIKDLREAISNGDTEGVNALLDYYPYIPTVDDYHRTALAIAAGSGSSQTVQILLQAGADVNKQNQYGNTALMHAAWYGHTEIAMLLLEAGADVTARDETGNTAFALTGDTEIAQILLHAGADINAQDDYGTTALMRAAGNGNLDIVKFLLQAGAEVNTRDNHGETALMYTLTHEVFELSKIPPETIESTAQEIVVVIQELIAAGADVNAKDNDGETALMKAAQEGKGLEVIANALIEAGAEE
jgi:ankyrin repeat protein